MGAFWVFPGAACSLPIGLATYKAAPLQARSAFARFADVPARSRHGVPARLPASHAGCRRPHALPTFPHGLRRSRTLTTSHALSTFHAGCRPSTQVADIPMR